MRRHWPYAFLIGFVAILTFRADRPTLLPKRPQVLPVREGDSSPESAGSAVRAELPNPVPKVEAGQEEAKPAARSVVLSGLLWALRHQNDDGSWGDVSATVGDRAIGKTGVTSLVLLSLFGAGYSHLSRDEYDEIAVGPQVKKGLIWLLAQQRGDGTFRSGHGDSFEHALAALALSDAFGMTVSPFLQEPAARSLDALVRLQGADGSWGGSTATPWAIEALVSGEQSEMPYPAETRERALAYLRTHPHPAQLEARLLLKDRSDPDAMESLAQSIASAPPRAGGTDFESLCHQSSGLYQYDGDGVLWKKWSPAARDALTVLQNPDGSWNGGSLSHRLALCSLAERSLQIYYRYSSSFTFGR
jgi:hypothetical protein